MERHFSRVRAAKESPVFGWNRCTSVSGKYTRSASPFPKNKTFARLAAVVSVPSLGIVPNGGVV